jgi:hypothetical protein
MSWKSRAKNMKTIPKSLASAALPTFSNNMDVYLLDSPFSSSQDFVRWRAPVALYIHDRSDSGRAFVTGGGLIQHGNAIYMLVAKDISVMKWSLCNQSSGSGSDHGRCQKVTRSVDYYQRAQPQPMGIMGRLVHFSKEYGYGLVRVDPSFYAGEEDQIFQAAIPIEHFESCIDEPQYMDCVEFTTAAGEDVTGVLTAAQRFCIKTNGHRKTTQGLVINTSSYAVAPEDCGVWVRRSIASDRPLLLGHVIGFSDDGSYDMLIMPFESIRRNLHQVLRAGRFNLL